MNFRSLDDYKEGIKGLIFDLNHSGFINEGERVNRFVFESGCELNAADLRDLASLFRSIRSELTPPLREKVSKFEIIARNFRKVMG